MKSDRHIGECQVMRIVRVSADRAVDVNARLAWPSLKSWCRSLISLRAQITFNVMLITRAPKRAIANIVVMDPYPYRTVDMKMLYSFSASRFNGTVRCASVQVANGRHVWHLRRTTQKCVRKAVERYELTDKISYPPIRLFIRQYVHCHTLFCASRSRSID